MPTEELHVALNDVLVEVAVPIETRVQDRGRAPIGVVAFSILDRTIRSLKLFTSRWLIGWRCSVRRCEIGQICLREESPADAPCGDAPGRVPCNDVNRKSRLLPVGYCFQKRANAFEVVLSADEYRSVATREQTLLDVGIVGLLRGAKQRGSHRQMLRQEFDEGLGCAVSEEPVWRGEQPHEKGRRESHFLISN